jgi:hypothetical protein
VWTPHRGPRPTGHSNPLPRIGPYIQLFLAVSFLSSSFVLSSFPLQVQYIPAGSRNLAAGIGYYAAALSFYENLLHHGRDVVFPRNTRIEIETSPLRAPVLTPKGQ